MLIIIRIILQVVGVGLGVYVLWSQNFSLMPYFMMILGIMMLVAGFERLQKDRKEFWGYMFVITSLFLFFVAAEGFIVNA